MRFQFQTFQGFPLRHAMSWRRPDLPSEGDIAYARGTNYEHISQNRELFLREAGFEPEALTLGRQVHGAGVSVVTAADRGRGQPPEFDAIPDSDGLVTACPEVALGTIVADCAPILLYDPEHHALGLVHAGWRGTVAHIAARAVELMAREFGTNPAALHAGIGPSIGACCYEVGNEVIDAWAGSGISGWEAAVARREPRPHFDLWAANRLVLRAAGVPDSKIEAAGECTRCRPERYFSHRAAMAGERARGRMIMVAQLV